MKKIGYLSCLLWTLSCTETMNNSQGEDFTQNVNRIPSTIVDESDFLRFFDGPRNPIKPKFTAFPTGSTLPRGWMLKMMQQDLEHGVVGALDQLYPGIVSDDLYRTARRGGMEDIPEMGDLVLTGAAWEKSIMWWNAETTGNWWDGFVRHAFLTQNPQAMEKSHKIIQNLLDSQDEDGYIGIYKPNLRYQHEGSNGELWSQTTAFRAMLAYYEFTQKQSVLHAVERGMALTMKKYGKQGKNPFLLKNAFGGVTHGLMMTDVCETLFRITDKAMYQDYASYLYRAFSSYSINRSFNDLRYPYLMEADSLFEGHAVHTYEHIRSLVQAHYHTGYPELQTAYDNMLTKLSTCLLPSGAGHGNEWISKKVAHPDHTAAEFCGMVELRNSLGSLFQKTGNVSFADAAEKLTYNAMFGARDHQGKALTYSKPDNCTILNGQHHEPGDLRDDPRYKYSPTHSEPAVCCAPNYGRNLTYLLDQMWLKAEDGIVAMLYGPSQLTTEIDDTSVILEQLTSYPLSDHLTIQVRTSAPVAFSLRLRKPSWAGKMKVDKNFILEGDYYVAHQVWENGDEINLTFEPEIRTSEALNGEVYLQRGPLVFAYPVAHREEDIKTYPEQEGFRDYYCLPEENSSDNLALMGSFKLKGIPPGRDASFYEHDLHLEGLAWNMQTQKRQMVKMRPMGNTMLRKVTFPSHQAQ